VDARHGRVARSDHVGQEVDAALLVLRPFALELGEGEVLRGSSVDGNWATSSSVSTRRWKVESSDALRRSRERCAISSSVRASTLRSSIGGACGRSQR
jgi:hypothetical protein